MAGLPLLIRLARQRADARRVALATAERERLAVLDQIAAQEAGMARETGLARGDAGALAAWAAWMRVAGRRRQELDVALRQAAEREEGLRAALREDFAEARRLEIALETRQAAAARDAARKAERMAEEMARQLQPTAEEGVGQRGG